jgi:hypothetical protein
MYAAHKGHAGTAQVLVNGGAKLDLQNKVRAGDVRCSGRWELTGGMLQAGWTALMLAAWSGRASTIQALLHCGADRNIRDHAGVRAMVYLSVIVYS